ncbi:hypothetical protein [Mesorhizobium koreense]|uniref:hypothetical protein n=1 Tax=Mesorhizobium koreense TaxID=3074855 RepID=UPI00287B96E3|nr:hypothetical protein [Mesorhizobium sp. WR6]
MQLEKFDGNGSRCFTVSKQAGSRTWRIQMMCSEGERSDRRFRGFDVRCAAWAKRSDDACDQWLSALRRSGAHQLANLFDEEESQAGLV